MLFRKVYSIVKSNQLNLQKSQLCEQLLPLLTQPLSNKLMQSIVVQGKAHFYEYMQIQLLQQYIQKGINYLVNTLLNSSPKLTRLRYYSQQISLVIDFLKQLIYLSKYNATYAEYFFGLDRQSILKPQKNKKLGKMRILYNTFIVTIVPYLIKKIDLYYNVIIEQQANQGKVFNSLQKIFTTIYPYLHMLLSLVQMLMKFRYLLLQEVKQYDLYYKASGVRLKYIQEEEEAKGSVHYPWKDLIKTPGLLGILIGHKVLSWYFNQKNQKSTPQRKTNDQQRYRSPLQLLSLGREKSELKQQKQYAKGMCMICSKGFTNPTVIKQNGLVYCYNCISTYVNQNGKCPMTNTSMSMQNLQLIYDSN